MQGFTACLRLAWERLGAALLRDDAGRERRASIAASRSDASRNAATATRCVRDTRGVAAKRYVSHEADLQARALRMTCVSRQNAARWACSRARDAAAVPVRASAMEGRTGACIASSSEATVWF